MMQTSRCPKQLCEQKKSVLNFEYYKIGNTFVCPSNSGLGTLTETTHVNPSLTCSPLKVMSLSWNNTDETLQY